jgi:site-specific DNA-cytosine methylase
MRVLVACEFSGTVRQTFCARGHDAYSCDLLPAEDGGPHIQEDVAALLEETRGQWDLMIAHPPCTYLTLAGLHWNNQTATGQNNLGPSADRWKIRSRTYSGIAEAMANQWG